MKLRNKKTSKVQTCDMVVISDEQIEGKIASLGRHAFIFRSIEQFNDRYEAYKPAEPLIKDPKVRKAVRAWAEANGTSILTYDEFYILTDEQMNDIEFGATTPFVGLKKDKEYTITELCGEEEE